jgi:hypothetical protein
MRIAKRHLTEENADALRRLVVTLSRGPEGDTLVRSCEVIGPGFRTRTSFGPKADLAQVFAPAIARAMEDCLSDLRAEAEVRSLPDLMIQTPGLVLVGAHVLTQRQPDGDLHVIVRFGLFLGALNAAFRQATGFDSGVASETERLSALVFADLVLPVLNLCQSAQQVAERGAAQAEPLAQALSEKWNELQFSVELLKRFVEFSPTAAESPLLVPVSEDRMQWAGPGEEG